MTSEVIKKYRQAKNRLILLDYDGTLVNYGANPDEVFPAKELLHLLEKLNNKYGSKVVIITGRGLKNADVLFNSLLIDIVMEHGAVARENNHWNLLTSSDEGWKKIILPVLNAFTANCPGSFTEEKKYSLAWHYRNADPDTGEFYSGKLISKLEGIIEPLELKIIDGNKVIEVIHKQVSKGNAVKYLLNKNFYDFILCIGDDKADEEMFASLLNDEKSITIKVGNGTTLAKYRLENVQQVLSLLDQLELS
ncbi:MAG TPA: trehalose-phosphatase [Chitinophagaceae bacterium]|nr:trehalose-phosphatase [Chitinophagaceae bacterium]